MKNKILKTALFFALPWTILMIVYNSISNGGLTVGMVVTNIIAGIIGGLLFALAINYAANRLYKKTIIEIDQTESLIKEDKANYFKGGEGVGGKLALTNKRLIFKSHNYNIQNHQQVFDIIQVKKAETAKSLKFLENVLNLDMINGNTHKFIVDEPKQWIKLINQQKDIRCD